MGPVDVNGGVHTARKQHQRKNIPICTHVASGILCGLGLSIAKTTTLFAFVGHPGHAGSAVCKPDSARGVEAPGPPLTRRSQSWLFRKNNPNRKCRERAICWCSSGLSFPKDFQLLDPWPKLGSTPDYSVWGENNTTAESSNRKLKTANVDIIFQAEVTMMESGPAGKELSQNCGEIPMLK